MTANTDKIKPESNVKDNEDTKPVTKPMPDNVDPEQHTEAYRKHREFWPNTLSIDTN